MGCRAIGATTLNEYRKYIEKDAALERRFQIVYVGEPNVEDTIAILRGLKERYETHHKIRIKDSAIVAAATLSHRYISDRFLPDKAIDLVDEAAAALAIQIGSVPVEIDDLERRATSLEIEKQALKRENGCGFAGTAGGCGTRAGRGAGEGGRAAGEMADGARGDWEDCGAEGASLEGLRFQAEEETRKGNLQRAAELQYGEIPKAEAELKALTDAADSLDGPGEVGDPSHVSDARHGAPSSSPRAAGHSRMLKEEVDEEDIAKIVSRWTGIPVAKMLEGEMQKLVQMEDRLRERVVGQDEALSAVANAIRRSQSRLVRSEAADWVVYFSGADGRG